MCSRDQTCSQDLQRSWGQNASWNKKGSHKSSWDQRQKIVWDTQNDHGASWDRGNQITCNDYQDCNSHANPRTKFPGDFPFVKPKKIASPNLITGPSHRLYYWWLVNRYYSKKKNQSDPYWHQTQSCLDWIQTNPPKL